MTDHPSRRMTILAGFTRAGFVHWYATVSLLHPAITIIPTIIIISSPVAIAVSHCATADQLGIQRDGLCYGGPSNAGAN